MKWVDCSFLRVGIISKQIFDADISGGVFKYLSERYI